MYQVRLTTLDSRPAAPRYDLRLPVLWFEKQIESLKRHPVCVSPFLRLVRWWCLPTEISLKNNDFRKAYQSISRQHIWMKISERGHTSEKHIIDKGTAEERKYINIAFIVSKNQAKISYMVPDENDPLTNVEWMSINKIDGCIFNSRPIKHQCRLNPGRHKHNHLPHSILILDISYFTTGIEFTRIWHTRSVRYCI